ncbi:MAG: glutaredoxin [Hyphomicrobiales bacterium]
MAKIEIFSSPQCGYCNQAKDLLRGKDLAFEDLDISEDAHRQAFMDRLPRARAIPQIFIDGEHIGGYEDLRLLDENGRLDEMVR